jgi:hypothetical protein
MVSKGKVSPNSAWEQWPLGSRRRGLRENDFGLISIKMGGRRSWDTLAQPKIIVPKEASWRDNAGMKNTKWLGLVLLVAGAGVAWIETTGHTFSSEAGELSLASSRIYGKWRVDCSTDSSTGKGQALYVFRVATPGDYKSAVAADFSSPEASGLTVEGQPLLWVADHSWSCRAKGFYALRAKDGSVEPARLSNVQGRPDKNLMDGELANVRQWNGWRVECVDDASWATDSKGFYQARRASLDELAVLEKWDGGASDLGGLGGREVYFVPDSSWSCRVPGFYAMRLGSEWVPAGLTYGFKVGKSTGSAAVVVLGSDGALTLGGNGGAESDDGALRRSSND